MGLFAKLSKIDWNVVTARLSALAGLFAVGGSASGLLPPQWKDKAAAVAAAALAIVAVTKAVQTPAGISRPTDPIPVEDARPPVGIEPGPYPANDIE